MIRRFLGRAARNVVLTLLLPLALISVILLRCMYRWHSVKVYAVPLRIGPLVGEASVHIRELLDSRNGDVPRKKILAFMEDPSATNNVLAKYLGEAAGWIWVPRWLGLLMMKLIRSHRVFVQLEEPGLTEEELHESYRAKEKYHIKLKNKDENCALRGLTTLGLRDEKPLAAFLTRDSAYLRTIYDNEELIRRHSYRDCTIDNYYDAVDHATALGWQCIHVGRKYIEAPRPTNTPLIQYPSSTVNSDLMDLVLALHSKVLFTCSSGLDTLYSLLGVPLVGINIPYLRQVFETSLISCMPKRMFVVLDGSRVELPAWTSLTADFQPVPNGATWRTYPVQFVENTPSEILEAVKFGLDLIENPKFRIHREQESRQQYSYIEERTGIDASQWPAISFPDSVMSRSADLLEVYVMRIIG